MKVSRELRNLKVFGTKRKFNRPRGAIAITHKQSVEIKMPSYTVLITNKDKNTIYARAE